jgi:hypothetical protein
MGLVVTTGRSMSDEPEPIEVSRREVLRDRVGFIDRRVRGAAANATVSLGDAVSALYERSIDRVLASSERVSSAAEGRALLAAEEGREAVADSLQSLVILAVPVVRAVARGAKFTKVPWALVGSTVLSSGLTVHTGAREVQVLGSLVAHRIEETTGQPADPGLVKKITVELYLKPKHSPELSDRRLRLHRLIKRWVFRGAIGRTTGRNAKTALQAAERLDLRPLIARWAELGARSTSPPGNEGDTRPHDAR